MGATHTLALVCLLVVAGALPVAAAADGRTTTLSTATATADVAEGPAASHASNGNESALQPGEQLSSTIASHEARVSGSLEASMVEVELAAAGSDRERARRLSTLGEDLEGEINDLTADWRRTVAQHREGEIDDATFRYRTARLAARASALASLSETARVESVTIPSAIRNETSLDERSFATIAWQGTLISANVSESSHDDEIEFREPDESYLFGDRTNPGFDTDFDLEALENRSRHHQEFNESAFGDHYDEWDDHHDGPYGDEYDGSPYGDFNESAYGYDYNFTKENYEAWTNEHDIWDDDYEFNHSTYDHHGFHHDGYDGFDQNGTDDGDGEWPTEYTPTATTDNWSGN